MVVETATIIDDNYGKERDVRQLIFLFSTANIYYKFKIF